MAAAAVVASEEAEEEGEAAAFARARSTSPLVGGHHTVTVFDLPSALALAAGEDARSPAARRS